MARLLRADDDNEDIVHFGAPVLVVSGQLYQNTAAKFWSSLIDELAMDYSSCTSVSLATMDSVRLGRILLSPQDSLQRDFESLAKLDFAQVLRETVEELQMFGPPPAVNVQLFSDVELMASERPHIACVDASVLAYLVVWLFDWAGIPEDDWNAPVVEGKVNAHDCYRQMGYALEFDFKNHHLSEGLFDRRISVVFRRTQSGSAHSGKAKTTPP
jgi:hypothetical protein